MDIDSFPPLCSSDEPFDEGAAAVRKMLQRDRKELTGVEEIGAAW